MNDQYQLSDLEFSTAFKNATLNSKLFNHEAHPRLAWIYINRDGFDDAITHVCSQIINYATSLGAADKYNETVTVAAVKAVYHFYLKSKSDNFRDFIEEFPRLKTNFKDLLAQHYGIDIFNSDVAKCSFLEPDLLPFD
jgi:hypothetical protein